MAMKPKARKAKTTKKTSSKAATGNRIKPGAVLAIYFNSSGLALQQERITPAIRSQRILGKDVPIPSADGNGGGGACTPPKFRCPLPGGGFGCCG